MLIFEKKKSYKWILKNYVILLEHWSILYKFLVEKTSRCDWYLKQCSQGPGGPVLTFWSTRTGRSAGVTVLITQNQKERLTKVLSPSTFCNQPVQPVCFALPFANEIGFVWFVISLRALRTARSVSVSVLASTDRSWCPRRREQERQKKQQNKFTSDLQTVSFQLAWQTPEIRPFISSFFFFFWFFFFLFTYFFFSFFFFSHFQTSKRGGKAHQGRDGEWKSPCAGQASKQRGKAKKLNASEIYW